jgi:hypothetical protein
MSANNESISFNSGFAAFDAFPLRVFSGETLGEGRNSGARSVRGERGNMFESSHSASINVGIVVLLDGIVKD